jgi:peptidyl-prolyl cis-trans isomerase C
MIRRFAQKPSYVRIVYSLALFGFALISSAALAAELARINSRSISVEEFNKRYSENLKFFQLKAPSKKSVLDDLIKRELGVQEAKKLGLDKDPEIQERLNTVLFHALLERRLNSEFEKIDVTDGEAKAHYQKYPELRTSHIFIGLPPTASKEQEKIALDRITQIQKGPLSEGKMSFSEVAQRFSEGSAAALGGDLDYQSREKLEPAFYDAALKLKSPGATSSIIRTAFGYHIIKLTGVRRWEECDQAQVKKAMTEEKRTQIFDRFIAGLRKTARVSINEALLTP